MLSTLHPFYQLVMYSTGSVTRLLNVYYDEPITVKKLHESIAPLPKTNLDLELDAGEQVMHREIMLLGTKSRRRFLHAYTCLAIDRVPKRCAIA